MTEIKKAVVATKQAAPKKTGWHAIKGYKRDYLLDSFKNRTLKIEEVVGEAKKLGLKEVTVGLKLRRWFKAGKVHKDSEGLLVFAK